MSYTYPLPPRLQPIHMDDAVPHTSLDSDTKVSETQRTRQQDWNWLVFYEQQLECLVELTFGYANLPWPESGWSEWQVEWWTNEFGPLMVEIAAGSGLLDHGDGCGFHALNEVCFRGQIELAVELTDAVQQVWNNLTTELCKKVLELHSIHVQSLFASMKVLPQETRAELYDGLLVKKMHRCVPNDTVGLMEVLGSSVPWPRTLTVPMLDVHGYKLQFDEALLQSCKDMSRNNVHHMLGKDSFHEFVQAWMRSISVSVRPQDMDRFVNADPFGVHMPLAAHVLSTQLCIDTNGSHKDMPALLASVSTAMALVAKMTHPQGCSVSVNVFRIPPKNKDDRDAFEQHALKVASRVIHLLARDCFSSIRDKFPNMLVKLSLWESSTQEPIPNSADKPIWLQRRRLGSFNIEDWCELADESAANQTGSPVSSDDATFAYFSEFTFINGQPPTAEVFPYPDVEGFPCHLTLTDRTSTM
ncbi:hypothetical protein NX059_012423 [Plenodomus lindquistii]|nr:hypothetical protein NX059_012423 [Plenodomus lindquistii]